LTNKNRIENIFVYLKNKLLQRKLKASEWFCEEKKRLMTFHWIQIFCAESLFFLIFLGLNNFEGSLPDLRLPTGLNQVEDKILSK
jgi:hypothetical protein